MEIGKISETVLKRSVFKQLKHRRSEVLVRPGVGEDCSVIEVSQEEAVVLSTDPITGTANEIGTLAVHITANDIASSGAELIGIMLTIILPPETAEEDLRQLIGDMEAVCESLDMEIIGGHTEVSAVVNQPLVTVTGVGKVKKAELVTTAGLKPGQELVMTKWAGLEGTAILATDREKELKKRFPRDFLLEAKGLFQSISVVKEAGIAKRLGAVSMHDATEGGIFGALWEIGCASGVGIEVDLKKIPIRQETIEICEFYGLNPYMLISSGCLVIGTENGSRLVEALAREGIPASVIGWTTEGNDKVIWNNGERRFLEPPKTDELYKVSMKMEGGHYEGKNFESY